MKSSEFITETTRRLEEKWSQKYKSSINCSHPKGFSQRAHCAGKNKHNESVEMEMVCEDCGMCQTHGNLNEIAKGAKDANGVTKCWPGKHAEGTKTGKNGGQVRNCVPNESVDEAANAAQQAAIAIAKKKKKAMDEAAKHGLYYNVNKRKAAGTSRDASSPKAPTAQAWRDAAKTAKNESVAESEGKRCMQCGMINCKCPGDSCKCKPIAGWIPGKGFKKAREEAAGTITEDLNADQQFDIIEDMVMELAEAHGVDADEIWEDFEAVDDHELYETAAWRRSAGKSKKGGLNAKGVASYRAEHPGSHLQMAVTTKPSKLKPGSKAAKRRKSFCARMSGVKGPMKKPNGKPTRKALALRKWNC